MKKGNLLLVLAGAAVFTSCLKDKYGSEIELDYSPTISLPLIEANVITKDLLAGIDTNVISTGSDNVLRVVFNDTLKSIGLDEFLTIESKAVVDSSVVGSLSIEVAPSRSGISLNAMKLGLSPVKQAAIDYTIAQTTLGNPVAVGDVVNEPAGEQPIGNLKGFTTVTFSEGQMKIAVTNKFSIPVDDLEMELKSNGDLIGTFNYSTIPPGMTVADSISLVGETMTPDMSLNFTSFGSRGSNGVPVPMDGDKDSLVFDVAMTGLSIRSGSVELTKDTTHILNQTVKMDLGLTDEVIEKITFSKMSMAYDVDLGLKSDAKIYVTLPNATLPGTTKAFSDSIVIGSTGKKTGNFVLDGYEVTLDSNRIETNMTVVLIKTATPIDFDSANVARFTFTPSSIKVAAVEGYFGEQIIDFAGDTVSTGISGDELLNSLELVSPVITMYFDNSFGIPMQFSELNLLAIGGTSEVTVKMNQLLPFDITEGTTVGASVTSSLAITAAKTENTIADAINAQAQKIVVGGKAIINPLGNTGATNKADTTSKLTVRLNVEVPMHGKIKGMIVLDTLDLAFGDIADGAELIVLRSVIKNDFPLDGEIQMIFTDASYTPLDSLVVPKADGTPGDGTFMKAAEVDPATGITTSTGASTKTNDFTLNKATLAKLGPSKYIILKVKISSGNDGTEVMKILSTYNMNIKLGMMLKVQVGDLLPD
ncbi:MAG: hypothetical protein ACJAZ2_001401 [Glaciecola sp.]|jgi:hypothetical protein